MSEPRRPLRSFALEGLVIVGSILLAFSIDAWWSAEVERREREELLDQLQSELRVVRGVVLPQAAENAERVELGSRRLLTHIHDPSAGAPRDSLHADLWWIQNPYRSAAATPVLEMLAANGGLERIDSSRLRGHLSAVVAFASLVRDFERSEQRFIEEQMSPWMAQRYDGYAMMRRMNPEWADAPESRFDVEAGLDRLLADSVFSAMLVRRRELLSTVRFFRSTVSGYADSAIVAIEAR